MRKSKVLLPGKIYFFESSIEFSDWTTYIDEDTNDCADYQLVRLDYAIARLLEERAKLVQSPSAPVYLSDFLPNYDPNADHTEGFKAAMEEAEWSNNTISQRPDIEVLYDEIGALYKRLSGHAEHWSDCATNNSPALKPEACDCGGCDGTAVQT